MPNVNRADTWFQRLPTLVALALAAVAAGVLSLVTGVAAGWIAIFVYDRGAGKINDLVVGLSALFAVGTFVFVTCFSWISSLHHRIQWRTPVVALVFCLGFVTTVTCMLWDDNYSEYILAGWSAILVCALVSVPVASRFAAVETADD